MAIEPKEPADTGSSGAEPHIQGKARRLDAERLSLAAIVDLVRSGAAATRLDIERATGLGRAVVTDRLATLFQLGLIEDGELGPAMGGRAPRIIRFRDGAGVILVSVLDRSRLGVGIADLSGRLLAEHHEAVDLAAGPAFLHRRVGTLFEWLLDQHRGNREVWGVALAAPGPVEDDGGVEGASLKRSILPGWEDYPIVEHLKIKYRAPIWMRSRVHAMAYGEFKAGSGTGVRDLIFVNLGRTISAGIISEGRPLRGARGSAGMIGHVAIEGNALRCSCGNTGCLETIAGDEAIVREGTRLARDGLSPQLAEALTHNGRISSSDVSAAARSGDPACAALLARCGQLVGTTLAALTNALNPALIVLGGDIGQADDILLAAVREAVYRGSYPRITRDLRIVRSPMGNSAGLTGSALMMSDDLLNTNALSEWIGYGAPQCTPELARQIQAARQLVEGERERPPPPTP